MSPLFTIITVSYNSQRTIEKTIHSVLGQDYPHIEYIIVDGGSNDGTQVVINPYLKDIALFISEPDKGIYDAMNKGIMKATGEVIGFLNADDVYANHRIITNIANRINEVDACFGDLIYFNGTQPEKIIRYWKSAEFKKGAFARGWCPPHPTFFVKRQIYLQYGLFNTSLRMGNDVELMMRFLEKYQIKSRYIPEVLVKMRTGGVSNAHLKNIYIQNKSILQAAAALNIPISTLSFIFFKLLNRARQFVQKPTRGSFYAK